MVVRTTSEISGSAFPFTRTWHKGVAAAARGLATFASPTSSLRNARSGVVELAHARSEREEIEAFLADHASAAR